MEDMCNPPPAESERPMGAEPWPDQKPVQIGGAISSERAIFVTAVLFIQQADGANAFAFIRKGDPLFVKASP
jgi:hypothetical protein